jgi:hypothetical protein
LKPFAAILPGPVFSAVRIRALFSINQMPSSEENKGIAITATENKQ